MQLTQTRTAPFAASETARRWLVPGLAAGAGFLAIEMLAGSFTTSIWNFPESIAQTIGMPVLLGAVPFWASFVGRTSFGVILAIVYANTWRR